MRSVQLWEAVPFSVMVTMEGCTIILTIWAKTVMTVDGMSPFVFVVYTHALSSLILLLYSFIFHCPRFSFFLPLSLSPSLSQTHTNTYLVCNLFFFFSWIYCRNRGGREQSLFSLNLFVRCFFLGLTGSVCTSHFISSHRLLRYINFKHLCLLPLPFPMEKDTIHPESIHGFSSWPQQQASEYSATVWWWA